MLDSQPDDDSMPLLSGSQMQGVPADLESPPPPPQPPIPSFGKPNSSLGNSSSNPRPPPTPDPHLSDVSTPPPPLLPNKKKAAITRQNTIPSAITRRELERDRKQTRIPSSRSPSPMKLLPSQAHPPPPPPVSPVKISPEATKALKDSITSLLGKRQSSLDEEPETATGRAGKRTRPHRSKVRVSLVHLNEAEQLV